MKTTTKFMYLAFALCALACIALLPSAQAVVPPPDGGYPGQNTAEGEQALLSLTTGVWNTAVGFQALKSDTTANGNTATGGRALFSNTTGGQNTANGAFALFANTVGGQNSAFGWKALWSNTTGNSNTAVGYQALFSNMGGFDNTAIGDSALQNNTDGIQNTANGSAALYQNTRGFSNTAIGEAALLDNTRGNYNTAIGTFALENNKTGVRNTAIGSSALNQTTGSNNIAIGANAGHDLTTGELNIIIGTTFVEAGESRTIRIGLGQVRTFIEGIFGTTVVGSTVAVTSDGQLGVAATSSARFKDDVKPMDNASEVIFALRPVTFHYKKAIDRQGIPQFGLVAEDVEAVNPELVVRDKEGKPYSVRYEAVNAMLLNEFLKEHRKNEEQGRDIQEQKATIALQQKQIDALTAGLQKVSAQVEASKPAPQVVNNP